MSIKQQRVAEQMRKHLSEIFLVDVSDPRLWGLTVTDVKIDKELKHAHVYVASADDTREAEVNDAIDKANSYIRRELAQRMQLRTMPMLNFHWDVTLARAESVNSILDSLDIPDEE